MGQEQSVIAKRHSEGSISTSVGSEAFLKLSPKMSLVYKRVMSTLENKRNIHSPTARMRRAHSVDSTDEWGFFEDFEQSPLTNRVEKGEEVQPEDQSIQRALSLPPPATAAPMYVLESTLATQQLWYSTAGLRPKQPSQEREYFENLWKRNFENSDVPDNQADIVGNEAVGLIPKKVRDEVPFKEFDGEILFRGKGPFSNSVSKSFSDHDVAAMTLQVNTWIFLADVVTSIIFFFYFDVDEECSGNHQRRNIHFVRLSILISQYVMEKVSVIACQSTIVSPSNVT